MIPSSLSIERRVTGGAVFCTSEAAGVVGPLRRPKPRCVASGRRGLWRALHALACRALVIDDEVCGRGRTPDVERVFRRMILRLPLEVMRNEVDVVRVLAEAA